MKIFGRVSHSTKKLGQGSILSQDASGSLEERDSICQSPAPTFHKRLLAVEETLEKWAALNAGQDGKLSFTCFTVPPTM